MFKYCSYPTDAQAAELSRTLGCIRLVHDKAPADRTAAWSEQRRANCNESAVALTAWEKTDDLAFLNEVSSVPLQQGRLHPQTAFRDFFDQRARYPRFKSKKKSRASVEYIRSAFTYRDGQLVSWRRGPNLGARCGRVPCPRVRGPRR